MTADDPVWRAGSRQVEVLFVGCAAVAQRTEVLERVAAAGRPVAWLEQRHSAVCVEARPGSCGQGDALWSRERELVLSIATADCVPVVVAGDGVVVTVHAGWRGIVAGVVGRAVEAAAVTGLSAAWIGPCIGPCCYEVSSDVASRVEAACASRVSRPGPGGRPHLDLAAAVEAQLATAAVGTVERLGPCTRCSPGELSSYRREGVGAGRNFTFAWLRRPAEPSGRG